MKFLIVGGFLGSGKTSFILQFARYMLEERGIQKVVILENEIGEIGIDDKILSGSGYQVRGLFSGCVCCTMSGELPINVRRIQKDLDPEWIIMEATGVAFPNSIRQNLQESLGIPAQIVCIADAQRWERLVKPLAHLLPLQLEGADLVLLNKSDLVNPEELEAARESICSCNCQTSLVSTSTIEGIPQEVFDQIMEWGKGR